MAATVVSPREIAVRALHTLWQAFAAALGVWWIASGADLSHQITDVASAKRVAFSALAAAGAALLSALKTTLKQMLSNGDLASLAADVEKGTGFLADLPEPVQTAAVSALELVQSQLARMSPEEQKKLAAQLTLSTSGVSGSADPSAPPQTPAVAPEQPQAAPEPPAAPVAPEQPVQPVTPA